MLCCAVHFFPPLLRPTYSRLNTSNPNIYWKLNSLDKGQLSPCSKAKDQLLRMRARDALVHLGQSCGEVKHHSQRPGLPGFPAPAPVVSPAPGGEARMLSKSLISWSRPQLVALDLKNTSCSNLSSSVLGQKMCPHWVVFPW